MYKGRVLVIAGSDSGGGAGIQADIKTITMLGGYATTAITVLTAQNTKGVFGTFEISPEFIQSQIELVLSDIGADAIKIGMLHNVATMRAVAASLEKFPQIPVIVDPVMVSTSGNPLIDSEKSVENLKSEIISKAELVTPNIPEAEVLSGIKIASLADMQVAAQKIYNLGAANVLLKGGHASGDKVYDVLLTKNSQEVFESARIHTKNTHGTGCTLSSAIACFIAMGADITEAIIQSRKYLYRAIEHADELSIGRGNGPVNHNWVIRKVVG